VTNDDIEIIDVTPELAGSWLAANTLNRKIRPRQVKIYAADMTNGDWTWTGEPVRFDTAGRLIDGQHRLHAIMTSGATIRLLVVRNLPPVAQQDIDNGIPRKFNDVLTLRGESNASDLGAIIRQVVAWNRGLPAADAATVASVHEMLRVLDEHPELRDVTKRAAVWSRGIHLPRSVIGLLFWVFSRVDEESYDDALEFFDRLASETDHHQGEPIYELRRTLQAGTSASARSRSRTWLTAVTIKAWNAYRRGEQVAIYRYRPGGAKPESFPEPV